MGGGEGGPGGGTGTGTGGGGTGTGGNDDPCGGNGVITNGILPPDPCNPGGGDGGGWIPLVDEEYDPNHPFANSGYPIDAPQEPLINNGISVLDADCPPTDVKRLIGFTDNRKNTEDMQYGYDGNETGVLPFMLPRPNDELFTSMNILFIFFNSLDRDLAAIGDLMIKRFKDGYGGQFSNPILNQKVKENNSFINFMSRFGIILKRNLKQAGGDINNVSAIDLQADHPVFNGLYNEFHGLQILMNDTEYTEIQLEGFTIANDGKRIACVEVTIHDHFGLDKNDVLNYQANHGGFAAWWILQHKRNYRPFETIVKVRRSLEWYP